MAKHHMRTLPVYFIITTILIAAFTFFGPMLGGAPGWLPTLISREGALIDYLFWALVATCVLILAAVMSIIIYAVVHFRAAPGQMDDGAPIHGHHGLEIFWTFVPFVIVMVIAFASWLILVDMEKKPVSGAATVPVKVTAFQFGWFFSYPGTEVKNVNELVLPEGTLAEFDITSRHDDVIHAFWVPEARLKIDAVPGIHTDLQWTPIRKGTWEVVCAELCGSGHNAMRAPIRVVSDDEFEKWISDTEAEQAEIRAAQEGEGA